MKLLEPLLIFGLGLCVGTILYFTFGPKPTQRRAVPTIVQLHQLQKACILDNAEWAQFVFPNDLVLYLPISPDVQNHLKRKFAE